MANTFFEDNDNKEEVQEAEKIKLGETEFTAEELDELVGAGRRLKEIEEKQGQPIDEILTSWGKRGERIGKYKEENETLKVELDKYKNPPSKEQVDEEQVKAQILTELKKFGVPTVDEVKQVVKEIYDTNEAGKRMLSGVNKVLRLAEKQGRPTTTPEQLLEFMADPANPKDPTIAYKVMFDRELETWKEQQIAKLKQPTMTTQSQSTAGAKQPEEVKPHNREDLRNALRVAIHGEGGQ